MKAIAFVEQLGELSFTRLALLYPHSPIPSLALGKNLVKLGE